MINLVIPVSGKDKHYNKADFFYPKPLIEVNGTPMLELVLNNITKGLKLTDIAFILSESDCSKFHLDKSVELISPIPPKILKLKKSTAGALCSVLLTIGKLDPNLPLIISNSDQIISGGLANVFDLFLKSEYECMSPVIESVHPRWSYLREDNYGNIIEASEKTPVSKNAVAGVYFFKNTGVFFKNAISTVINNNGSDKAFYISQVYNQYILNGYTVGKVDILHKDYFSFYTPSKIQLYEESLK